MNDLPIFSSRFEVRYTVFDFQEILHSQTPAYHRIKIENVQFDPFVLNDYLKTRRFP